MLVLLASGLPALEWESLDVDFALSWQYNAPIGPTEDKYPSILMFNPGVSFLGSLGPGGLYFKPGAAVSWGTRDVVYGVARPAPPEAADHMKVLGLTLEAPIGYRLEAGSWTLGFQGGPALGLAFPLFPADGFTGDAADFWRAYYGKAQFLHLSLGAWGSVPVTDGIDLAVGLRSNLALSNLWVPEAPFFHGMTLSLVGSLRFGLPGRSQEPPVSD
jgi:hypothetical protein